MRRFFNTQIYKNCLKISSLKLNKSKISTLEKFLEQMGIADYLFGTYIRTLYFNKCCRVYFKYSFFI